MKTSHPPRCHRRRPPFLLILGGGCLLVLAPFVSPSLRAQKPAPPAVADPHLADLAAGRAAAEAWLGRVDAGEFGQSWRETAGYFQGLADEATWSAKLAGARLPLGKMLARTLTVSRFSPTLPGMPEGKYVFLQYETAFEKKKAVVETLVPMLDQDGRWKVAGYYLK